MSGEVSLISWGKDTWASTNLRLHSDVIATLESILH